jgi:hypothetical protein
MTATATNADALQMMTATGGPAARVAAAMANVTVTSGDASQATIATMAGVRRAEVMVGGGKAAATANVSAMSAGASQATTTMALRAPRTVAARVKTREVKAVAGTEILKATPVLPARVGRSAVRADPAEDMTKKMAVAAAVAGVKEKVRAEAGTEILKVTLKLHARVGRIAAPAVPLVDGIMMKVIAVPHAADVADRRAGGVKAEIRVAKAVAGSAIPKVIPRLHARVGKIAVRAVRLADAMMMKRIVVLPAAGAVDAAAKAMVAGSATHVGIATRRAKGGATANFTEAQAAPAAWALRSYKTIDNLGRY